MSQGTPLAVFLSYAHEDLDAARRLAEGLRGSGLEVWFDQEELRGGDAWDQKIRRQIKECALFLPVVSRSTESREEAYFRLEWHLAAERTHLMTEGRAFVIPVAIDDIPDAGAKVPAEFLKVQWTRLPGGAPTARFLEQVNALLARHSPAPARSAPGSPPTVAAPAASAPVRQTPSLLWAGIAAAALIVVAAGLWWKNSSALRPSPSVVGPPSSAPALPPIPTDKSIAVLPFTNASADGASASFISDGIQEEILNRLRQIGALRVPSIDSVNPYRDTTKPNERIAAELKVAYLIKGTVRRAGETIQVTCRLIDVRSGNEITIGPFVEDQVTVAKLIATQAKIAQQIAAELKTTLTPEEKARIERRPTENFAAYQQYLKARQAQRGFGTPLQNAQKMQPFLLEAVKLDPDFADAYAELVYAYVNGANTQAGRLAILPQAKDAVDNLKRLAPEAPELPLALGDYYLGSGEFDRAIEQYDIYGKTRPKDPDYLARLAEAYQRKPDPAKAWETRKTLENIDPGHIANLFRLVQLLYTNRRFKEAAAVQIRIVALDPDNLLAQHFVGYMNFFATGATAQQNKFWKEVGPEGLNNDISHLNFRRIWARITGNLAEAVRLDLAYPIDTDVDRINMAIVHAARGDLNSARERLGDLPERLRGKPAPTANDLIQLGTISAVLGEKTAAPEYAARALAISPSPTSVVRYAYARLYAWAGEPAKAMAELAAILPTAPGDAGASAVNSAVPIVRNVHALKKHPDFAPIQNDLEFLKLLADPKNNAPLF